MSNQRRMGGNRPLRAFLAGLARLIRGNGIGPMRRSARRRTGERSLTQLNDHLLRDIGLTRAEVQAAAYGLLRLGDHPAGNSTSTPPAPDRKVVRPDRRAVTRGDTVSHFLAQGPGRG